MVSSEQRGIAAHIRQMDDNNDRKILTKEDRDFCDTVVRDKSMEHKPEFDTKLQEWVNKYQIQMNA
jgi:hypothetical protein